MSDWHKKSKARKAEEAFNPSNEETVKAQAILAKLQRRSAKYKRVQPESKESPMEVQPQSNESLIRLQLESNQSPIGLQLDSNLDSDHTPARVQSEYSESIARVQSESNGCPIYLSEKESLIYKWFKQQGTGTFTPKEILKTVNVSRATVFNTLKRFRKEDVLVFYGYNHKAKREGYKLNDKKNIVLSESNRSLKGLQSESNQGPIGLSLDSDKSSYNQISLDRQIDSLLKNLSVYLENSDFWKKAGLSMRKAEIWCAEIEHCTPDWLEAQLRMGEVHPAILNSKVSILGQFHVCIRNGGLSRPSGFEMPEERAMRIMLEENEKAESVLALKREALAKKRELADEAAFVAFLEDLEAVGAAIEDIEKEYATPRLKASISIYKKKKMIDTRLSARLKKHFDAPEG